MPKGIKINWSKYKKEWMKFDGTIKEFCEQNNLGYSRARLFLKETEKKQIKSKKDDVIEKTINQQIEKEATEEGLEIARIYTEQNEDLAKLKTLKELFQKKINKINENIDKSNEIKSSELVELSLIAERLFKATKTIIEYVGKKYDIEAKVDQRTLSLTVGIDEFFGNK